MGYPRQHYRIGLTLSGGGFRATLFHLGVVRLLYETGRLKSVTRVGAVSGGSILAAHVVLRWDRYTATDETFDDATRELLQFIQDDIRGRVVRRWIFAWISVIPRFLLPKSKRWTSCNLLQYYYARLFQNATLKDLRGAGRPEVAFNCTSLSTGSPCFFGPFGFTWYDSGEEKFVATDEAPVALAITASSAFPPLFPPIEISNETLVCRRESFRESQYLTDGGVYDNLGIDRLIYRQTKSADLDIFLVSDAEGDFDSEFETSYTFVVGRNVRASDLLMTRVSSLLMGNLRAQKIPFMQVGIKGEINNSILTVEKQRILSKITTDLDSFTPMEMIALIAHGFCVARDALLRQGLLKDLPEFTWDPLKNVQQLQSRKSDEFRWSSRRKWRLWSFRDWSSWATVGIIIGVLFGAFAIQYQVAEQVVRERITQPSVVSHVTIMNDPYSNAGAQSVSQASYKGICVDFFNQASERVDLYWVDFGGGEVLYASIDPQRHVTLATFTGHLWIAKTIAGRQLLKYVVQNS
jgi:predicted acylesterase/phospholipase RssA